MLSAVESGDAKKVAELIRQDPGFKVNVVVDGLGRTLLHRACGGDWKSPAIPLLLAHPDIDVNSKNNFGGTPFYVACYGHPSCVREMLKDSRVKGNEPANGGSTPLYRAAANGHLDVIKWWVASGREMDLGKPEDVYETDAIGVSKKIGFAEVATLLERFKENPVETRHARRLELGWYDEAAAEMFALVVFVSDGLVQVKDTKTATPAARFFKLPEDYHLNCKWCCAFARWDQPRRSSKAKRARWPSRN